MAIVLTSDRLHPNAWRQLSVLNSTAVPTRPSADPIGSYVPTFGVTPLASVMWPLPVSSFMSLYGSPFTPIGLEILRNEEINGTVGRDSVFSIWATDDYAMSQQQGKWVTGDNQYQMSMRRFQLSRLIPSSTPPPVEEVALGSRVVFIGTVRFSLANWFAATIPNPEGWPVSGAGTSISGPVYTNGFTPSAIPFNLGNPATAGRFGWANVMASMSNCLEYPIVMKTGMLEFAVTANLDFCLRAGRGNPYPGVNYNNLVVGSQSRTIFAGEFGVEPADPLYNGYALWAAMLQNGGEVELHGVFNSFLMPTIVCHVDSASSIPVVMPLTSMTLEGYLGTLAGDLPSNLLADQIPNNTFF